METKKWYHSLTIWGVALLALCGLVLPLLGKADVAAILAEENASIVDWLAGLGNVIGGALAIIGRIRAATKITG